MSEIGILKLELEALKARVALLEARGTTPTASPVAIGGSVQPADDADLDGKYGDPLITKDPARWSGPSFKGKRFSQCTAQYLDAMSGFLVWRANKEHENPEKAKYARYSLLDARRAAGWAARIRKGYAPPPEPEVSSFSEGSSFSAPTSFAAPMASDDFSFGANAPAAAAEAEEGDDIPW